MDTNTTTATPVAAAPAAAAPAVTPSADAMPAVPTPSVTTDAANLAAQPVIPEAATSQPDPFNFYGASQKPEATDNSSTPQPLIPSDSADYSIDFGANYKGTDAERNFLTSTAHKHNIPAEAASHFFQDTIDYYQAQIKQHNDTELAALQSLWGAEFDKRMGRAAEELDTFCRNLGISQEQAATYMSPEAFFLVDYFVSKLSESRAVGTNSASLPPTGEAAFNALLSDPTISEVLSNPNHPRYNEVANKVNRAAGHVLY